MYNKLTVHIGAESQINPHTKQKTGSPGKYLIVLNTIYKKVNTLVLWLENVILNKREYMSIQTPNNGGKGQGRWSARLRVEEMREKIRQGQVREIRKVNFTLQKYNSMWIVSKCNKQNNKFLEDRK